MTNWSEIKFIASKQSTEQLKQRISRGYAWLKENVNHPKYAEHLKLYEILVDEARKRGLQEEECWMVEDIIDEVEDIFQPPKTKPMFENIDKRVN